LKEEPAAPSEETLVVSTPENQKATPPALRAATEKPLLSETIRIDTAKLDSLLLQAEEMLSVKLAASQRAADIQDIKVSLDLWRKEWAKASPEVQTVRQLFEGKFGGLTRSLFRVFAFHNVYPGVGSRFCGKTHRLHCG